MIQLCKRTGEFPMVQHIDQIVCVAVAMRDGSHRPTKLKGSSMTVVLHVRSPGPSHRKTMERLTKTRG